MSLCAARGAGASTEFQASSLTTLVQVVAVGGGITLVPDMALEVELRAERGLVAIPFPRPTPVRTVSLAWRPTSRRGAEFESFGRFLTRTVPARRRIRGSKGGV